MGAAASRGADTSAIIQTLPVTAGEKIVGTVRYRMPPGSAGLARLKVSWKKPDGAWLSAASPGFDADSCMPTTAWRQVLVCEVVPPGAAVAVFRFGGREQGPGDLVEFKDPYFAKMKPGGLPRNNQKRAGSSTSPASP